MNYGFSNEVIKILDDLAGRFGIAINWADQNVMPYVMELFNKFVSYKIAINIVPIIIFVIMSIANIWFWWKYYKCFVQAKKDNVSNILIDATIYSCIPNSYSPSTISIILGVTLVCFLFASTIAFICGISNLLKLVYIPELYIVECLANYL